jgi:hypothetical protein
MEIKAGSQAITAPNGTVVMESGDHLSVAYKTPDGKFHIFNISAQHMVFIATHEASDTSVIVRPGGVTTVG